MPRPEPNAHGNEGALDLITIREQLHREEIARLRSANQGAPIQPLYENQDHTTQQFARNFVLVIGVEGSGTTWISRVLGGCPDSLLYPQFSVGDDGDFHWLYFSQLNHQLWSSGTCSDPTTLISHSAPYFHSRSALRVSRCLDQATRCHSHHFRG
jgi:hypothetical protein